MPFTFCHPAIVLPLTKISPNKISGTGVIIGSMTPDFEYFFRMDLVKTYGHDLSAIFWFNLPLSIVLGFLYHFVIRDQFIKHLPHFLASRLAPFSNLNWGKWFKSHSYVFIYSAIIGIFSHLLWDSFTHAHGLFGDQLSFLKNKVQIGDQSVFIFSLLQQFCSITGGIYILYFLMKMPINKIKKTHTTQKIFYWLSVLFVFGFILLIRNPKEASVFIASGISAGMIGIILSSLLYQFCFKTEYK